MNQKRVLADDLMIFYEKKPNFQLTINNIAIISDVNDLFLSY